jgi:biopolymer transport protein ExbD
MSVRLDHGGDELVESHEINVTPFIDVMLVLLIIFMVAAPLATVDLPVDLPISNAAPQPRPEKPLFVTVKSDLSVAVDDKTVALNKLGQALDAAGGNDKEQKVFVRADRTVDYGHLMGVLNVLRDAGYLRVGLVGIEQSAGE